MSLDFDRLFSDLRAFCTDHVLYLALFAVSSWFELLPILINKL